MKKEKNLDELFRDKLLNYEKEPPAYLLENILEGVAGERRKRRLIFWRVAGVAAALLLAFIAGWQLSPSNDREISRAVVDSRGHAQEKTTKTSVIAEKKKLQNQIALAPAQTASIANNSINQKHTNEMASGSKSNQAALVQQSVENTGNLVLLVPIKNLYKQLQSENGNRNALHQKKNADRMGLFAEKSIDQQIMEHNRQMLLSENKSNEKTHWMVGAQVSPQYNVSRSSHAQHYASNMLSASSGSTDLGGGISVEVKKGRRWSIQSGVYYSGIDQSTGNKAGPGGKYSMDANFGSNYFSTAVNVDASSNKMTMNSVAGVIELNKVPSGMVLGTSLEDKTLASSVIVSQTNFIQNFDYIEIPVYLRYTLIDSRFDLIMLGGLSSNLLVGNQIFVEDASGKSLVGKTKDMEALNYSGTLGLGFRYGLSKHISLNIEPRIKYFLNSLNSNSSVSYKPYTIGIFTGLSYEF